MITNVDVTAVGPTAYLIYLLISILVSFRISALITIDDGPFDLIFMLRVWMGSYDRGENGVAKTSRGRLFACPHCMGVWVALAISLMIFQWNIMIPFIWFAIAGGQSWLESMRGMQT